VDQLGRLKGKDIEDVLHRLIADELNEGERLGHFRFSISDFGLPLEQAFSDQFVDDVEKDVHNDQCIIPIRLNRFIAGMRRDVSKDSYRVHPA
jgi:hypothetical protein